MPSYPKLKFSSAIRFTCKFSANERLNDDNRRNDQNAQTIKKELLRIQARIVRRIHLLQGGLQLRVYDGAT